MNTVGIVYSCCSVENIMNLKTTIKITILVLGLLAGLSASAREKTAPAIVDGLHLVPGTQLGLVYAEPEADLSVYSKLLLIDAQVAFKKNWDRDQRSRSASKLSTSSRVNTKKIKQDLAEEFEAVFTEALNSGGYEVVTEAADDVLLVRPAIVDLDINGPQTHGSGRSNTYTRSAGEMTLYIELFDSVTGDLIAKALDRKADTARQGFYTWTNSVTNKTAAKRILQGWAEILLDALNEAKQQ